MPFLSLKAKGGFGAQETPVTIDENVVLAAIKNNTPNDVIPAWTTVGSGAEALTFGDNFWPYPEVQLSRWSKIFPYQLLVLQAKTNSQGETTYTQVPGWQFTLPYPPESLMNNTQFASTVEATLNGVFEQHNGVPFRDIQLSGSFGVLAARGTAPQLNDPGFFTTIAGGTVRQLGIIQADSLNVGRSFLGSGPPNSNVHTDDDFDDKFLKVFTGADAVTARSTGYYQTKQLEKFLETYSLAKKRDEYSNLRLAWANWKDYQSMVTLVTPINFTTRRVSTSPMEYSYSLTFRGWKRVTVTGTTNYDTSLVPTQKRKPSILARILNTIRSARIVLSDVNKIPRAIIGDFDHTVMEPLRETTLFIKDALGTTMTLADLPSALKQEAIASYYEAKGMGQDIGKSGRAFSQDPNIQAIGKAAVVTVASMFPGNNIRVKSPPQDSVEMSQHDLKASTFVQQDAISINSLHLPTATMNKVLAERARVVALQRRDFEARRDTLKQGIDQMNFTLGVGTETVASTYGIKIPDNQKREAPSEDDWEALWALDDALQSMDSMVDNSQDTAQDSPVIDSMVQLTRRLGVAFQKPASKFAVPFPYKTSLQQLATTYLNDPDRWLEIAILNGLKPPYIDEVGFQLPLLVNGINNTTLVSFDDRLYVNQPVFLGSNGTSTTRHHITGLKRIGANLLVTVDGDLTVNYKISDHAYLQAFMPDTVNSQSLIYIPSDRLPLEQEIITTKIPTAAQFDQLLPVGGFDFLMTSSNDLIVGSDGDNRWAYGLQGIIQWTRVMLATPLGHLQLHPDFGLEVEIGNSTGDVDASKIANYVKNSLIKHGLFSSIDKLQVSKNGPVAKLDIAATIFGVLQPISVSYELCPGCLE